MSVPARIAGFLAALALVFGVATAVGSAVGPTNRAAEQAMHRQFLQNMKNGTAPEAGRTRQLSATILEFDRQMPAGMSAHGASTIRSRS